MLKPIGVQKFEVIFQWSSLFIDIKSAFSDVAKVNDFIDKLTESISKAMIFGSKHYTE